MKYLHIATLVLVSIFLSFVSNSTIKNTTEFFTKQVGYTLSFQSFSGYQDINWYSNNQTASMYYSLWQGSNQNWQDHSVPLIVWLQGGPGASSQFGCFNQVGPLFISGGDKSGGFKVIQNPWGWNFVGHLLCVDQPVGTGFSFNKGPLVDNTRVAAKHFANFLYNFNKNSQYDLGRNPLYLAGQSYAGHYIPAFAKEIISNVSLNFNLKGILIGDGWVDPYRQNNDFDSYLYSTGIISKKWKDTTRFLQTEAMSLILKGKFKEAFGYTHFVFNNQTVSRIYYNGMDLLNYRQYLGEDDGTNPQYGKFLQKNKKQFGVADPVNYIDDNQQMYFAFAADFQTSFKPELQYLLKAKIRVLIYNGQNDFLVNTAGVLNYVNNLRWDHEKQWRQTVKVQWKEGSKILGWLKKYQNLVFVIVRGAGHLVPTDQPKSAWYMVSKFIRKEW